MVELRWLEEAVMKNRRTIRFPQQTHRLRRPDVRAVMKAAHVVPQGEDWMVVKAGPKRTRAIFPSKRAALSYAETLSPGAGAPIMVHSMDGQVSNRKHPRVATSAKVER